MPVCQGNLASPGSPCPVRPQNWANWKGGGRRVWLEWTGNTIHHREVAWRSTWPDLVDFPPQKNPKKSSSSLPKSPSPPWAPVPQGGGGEGHRVGAVLTRGPLVEGAGCRLAKTLPIKLNHGRPETDSTHPYSFPNTPPIIPHPYHPVEVFSTTSWERFGSPKASIPLG